MPRLDAALLTLKLAPSRTKAQRLIEAGEVEVLVASEWRVIQQASYFLPEFTAGNVRLNANAPLLKYVSRGGLKLESALRKLALNPHGLKCWDVGLSTGGFSDCLLQMGAREVIGIDVGHGQLAEKLKAAKTLRSLEGVNIRALPAEVLAALEGVQLTVVDVSFISVLHVIPVLDQVLKASAQVLLLVKPQFEVGAKNLDKNGIVQDQRLFADVLAQVLHALERCGFSTLKQFPCEVKGQDGNQEFFVHAIRA